MTRRRPSLAALVIFASMLVVAVAITGYALASNHAVLPGMRGCELIRHTAPQSRCVVRQLRGAMRGHSTEAGLANVDELAAANALVASHCHLAMHPIGEAAGRRAAREHHVPSPANGSSTCRRGYMHGMMLGYVSRAKGGDVASVLPALCSRDQQDERSCAHVVGHLIAREAGQTRAEQAIATSCTSATITTDTAATAAAGVTDERECVRGGYMEIALTAKQPPLATWRSRCERSPTRTREECFAWLPPLAAYRQLPQRDAASECQRLPHDAAMHADCVAGVARVLTGDRPCDVFTNSDIRSDCRKFRARPR